MIEFYDPPRMELYDLKDDISEKNNLAERYPEKVKAMKQKLDQYLDEVNTKMHTLNQ